MKKQRFVKEETAAGRYLTRREPLAGRSREKYATKTAKDALNNGLKILMIISLRNRLGLNVDTARLIRTFMMDEYAVDTTMPSWKTMMSSVASSRPL